VLASELELFKDNGGIEVLQLDGISEVIISLDIQCHIFVILNLFSATFMFCNSAFEKGNLNLWCYINAVIIIYNFLPPLCC